MKTIFNSNEVVAILILELKVWSDAQLAVVADINDGPRSTVKSEDNCGLTTSFDCLTSREQFFADFSSDEDEESVEFGAEAHTVEYLANAEKEEKKEALIKASVILKTEKALVEGLSEDVVIAYAEQKVDLENAPNAISNKEREESVTVILKRLSNKGNWYTVTKEQDEYAPVFEMTFNVHDVFDVNGSFLTLKKYGNKTSLEMIMERYDLDQEYLYSYVDKNSGEMVFKSQSQALQMKGDFFRAGMTVEGVRLQATVAPFFHAFDEETEEVINAITYYGFDNMTEVAPGLLVIPSAVDESNGDAAENDFNEGIMYGTSQATQAMMSDDLADDAIRNNAKEEARCKREAKKARRTTFIKKDIKASKDEMLMNSEFGAVVLLLSDLSYKSIKSRKAELDMHKLFAEYATDLEKIKEVAEAYKRVNGKCLESKAWKTLNAMIDGQKNKKFAAMVESHILENIANINNGSLDIADIDDETLVEIRQASLKFGKDKDTKKPTLAWIHDATKSNAIKARYESIMNIKGDVIAKPRNGKVSVKKVG